MSKLYQCPCCGYFTLEEGGGNYEICEVCFWEDAPLAGENPAEINGANKISLLKARQNFREFGACRREELPHVRKPYPYEFPEESFHVEPVREEEAEELLAIYAPYVETTAISFEYDAPSLEEFAQRIRNISQKYPYLKAVKDGEILGYAYANSFKTRKAYDWSVETTIYVRQDCKRMGIGKRLYEELEKRLSGMGILNMNACIAAPREEDEYLTADSLYFHEKQGFKMVGRFHNSGYKFERWYDMIWMEKLIGEHDSPMGPVRFGQWLTEGEE